VGTVAAVQRVLVAELLSLSERSYAAPGSDVVRGRAFSASCRFANTMPACQPGGASVAREANRVDVELAARDQPGDERVRVPHLPGPQLVAPPDRRGHFRHQFEQPPCLFGVLAQALRALDRLGNVRDDAFAPATDLVAEEPEAAGCADADRAFRDDPSLSACAPCRRLLNHKPALGHTYFECRVVEIGAATMLQTRGKRFEHEPVQAH
jgi:hypothetical protein